MDIEQKKNNSGPQMIFNLNYSFWLTFTVTQTTKLPNLHFFWIVWLCLEQAVGWANWPSKSLLVQISGIFLKRCQNIYNLWVGRNIRKCLVLVCYFVGTKSELGEWKRLVQGCPESNSVQLCKCHLNSVQQITWVLTKCQALSRTLC